MPNGVRFRKIKSFFCKLFYKNIVKSDDPEFIYAMFLLHPTRIENETTNYSLNTLCICCKTPSLRELSLAYTEITKNTNVLRYNCAKQSLLDSAFA